MIRSITYTAITLVAGVAASAGAVPLGGYNVDITMTATVSSIAGGGAIYREVGGAVREYTLSELPELPLDLGDEIFLRWRIRPSQTFDCPSSAETLYLGGASEPAPSGYECLGPTAVTAEARLGNGETYALFEVDQDGIPDGRGPALSRETGEVTLLQYAVYEALTGGFNTCDYGYNPSSDTIEAAQPAECHQALPGLIGFYASAATGDGLFQFIAYGANGYNVEGQISYGFDVDWTVRQARRVPEPGALGLLGLGMVLIAGRRSGAKARQESGPARASGHRGGTYPRVLAARLPV